MPELCRQGDNTCNTRKVPIIFVPGVMGTRLKFSRKKKKVAVTYYWDPDSKRKMAVWALMSAEAMRDALWFNRDAEVMLDYDGSDTKQEDRGWGGPAKSYYRDFLLFLEDLNSSLCATCPVYACGYDWRQSNKNSGSLLDSTIIAVLKKESAENFILITHSMGGLVTRSCLSRSNYASKCLGVIHIAQPAQGAVKFYAMMYTGALLGVDTPGKSIGDRAFVKIQGDTAQSFATILSGMPGPCELIPTNNYEAPSKGPWLWDDRGPPSPPYGSTPWRPPVFRWYLDPSSPPNVFWSLARVKSTPSPADDLKARIQESELFHAELGMWKHPNTWSIYSTDLETDTSTRFNGHSKTPHGVERVRTLSGDATVPAGSASSLLTPGQTSLDESGDELLTKPWLRQVELKDVEHGAACNNVKVQTIVKTMLLLSLGCLQVADNDVGADGTSEAVAQTDGSSRSAQDMPGAMANNASTTSPSNGTVASNSDSVSSSDHPPDPSDWNTDDDNSAIA